MCAHTQERAGGIGGTPARPGGVGPPRPVRSPKGCESGKWVSEPGCAGVPPMTGPARLADRPFVNGSESLVDLATTGGPRCPFAT